MHLLSFLLANLRFYCIDSSIMMIEADVVIGRLHGENDSVAKRPIMAHPPATESDLSLIHI